MASYPPTFVLRPLVMTYDPGVVYRSCADGRAGRDGSNPAASIPKSENMGSLSRFPSVHLACTIRYIVHSHRGKSLVRSEEHTSELQSLMRISYAVFCFKKKNKDQHQTPLNHAHLVTR